MTDIGWGDLVDSESYGRLGDSTEAYQDVSYQDALRDTRNYKHAAHAMFFCRNDTILWDLYPAKASVMMQMRFDGVLGFPGGLVDEGEDPLAGVNRELEEEIALDTTKYRIIEADHVNSHRHDAKTLFLHFFAKEVSPEEFYELEKNHVTAPEHGIETLGAIRVPLFTMGDGVRGFPAFLANQFAGNAREQLISCLIKFKILTKDEVRVALETASKVKEENVISSSVVKKVD